MTNIELLKAALLKINAVDVNQAPTAEMGVNGLVSLNNLMAQWSLDGVDIGYYPQTDQDAETPITPPNLRAVIFSLAVELATDFGVTTSEEVRTIAENTYAALCKSSRKEFQADMTMLPQADGWDYGNFFASGGFL